MQSDTSRARELREVFGYAVAIVVTAPVIATKLGVAWTDRGLPYHIISTVTGTAGVNFDLGVLVPLGFILGLLSLFALDQYKRIQAGLLILGSALFTIAVVQRGFWTELIAWDQYWWGLIIGASFSLIGLHGAKTPTQSRREFPAAAGWLYRVTALVIVVGLFEYHLTYGDGFSVQRWDFYLTIPASMVLLIAVGEFVKYSNRKDVVIIGGGDVTEANFLGGLFEIARDRFDGVPLDPDGDGTGAIFLNRAASANREDALPERDDAKTVSFRYTPGGFFNRQIVITANRYEAPTKRDLEVVREQIADTHGPLRTIGRFTKQRFTVLVPKVVANLFQTNSNRMTERLRFADSILMLVPISDFVREEDLSNESFEDWRALLTDSQPHYMDVYRELCEIYSRNDRRAIIVAMEADLAMSVYEERETRYPSFRDNAFRSFLQDIVLTANNPEEAGRYEVIPVDRHIGDDEEKTRGFNHLLRELSR